MASVPKQQSISIGEGDIEEPFRVIHLQSPRLVEYKHLMSSEGAALSRRKDNAYAVSAAPSRSSFRFQAIEMPR